MCKSSLHSLIGVGRQEEKTLMPQNEVKAQRYPSPLVLFCPLSQHRHHQIAAGSVNRDVGGVDLFLM